MQYIGTDFCEHGYYVGRNNKVDASEEDCKNLCVKEEQCKFAAYFNTKDKKTCRRYNKDTCTLDTTNSKYDAEGLQRVKTFAKTYMKANENLVKKGLSINHSYINIGNGFRL